MEYARIKNTDLYVSRICGGGCPLGGYGWGGVQEEELYRAVRAAVEGGVNFFDTADTYGLGTSEERLSRALSFYNRKELIIATKFGVCVEKEKGATFYNNRPDYIEKALEGSLKRLHTDYIDLYQIHYRDGKTPLSAVIEKLEELRKKGWIRYFGLSNPQENDFAELDAWKKDTGRDSPFVSFQEEYSLACRKHEKIILKATQEYGMTLLSWGSLGQGVLTGKYDASAEFCITDRRSREEYVNFHGEKLKQNLRIVEKLRRIAEEIGSTPAAAAIRYILDTVPGSIALTGFKKPEQIKENIEAARIKLSKEQIRALTDISEEV